MITPLFFVTLYGGVDEVGGNKVLLSSGSNRIFLDFGKTYARWTEYYETPFLKPNSIRELIQTGIIPAPKNEIDNLYTSCEKGSGLSVDDEKEPKIDTCIYSHVHGDHLGYMSLLNRKITMYMGEATRTIQKAYKEHGRTKTFETNLEGFDDGRNVVTFRTGDTLEFGDFKIYPISVDHSVPGAYGFIIETDKARIVYTGDLRRHGPAKELTDNFLKKIDEFKPIDFLICEGTSLCKPAKETRKTFGTENDVKNHVFNVIKNCKGLLVVNISSIDTDRINTFFEVANHESVNRQIAISLKIASTLSRLKNKRIKNFPQLSETSVYCIERSRPDRWQTHFLAGAAHSKECTGEVEHAYGSSFKCALTAEDIVKNPQDYILLTAFYSLSELRELFEENNYTKFEDGAYIMSTSEPFSEELEIEFRRLSNWIKLIGLNYEYSHCSGHAHKEDLTQIVNYISPKKGIIPLHTTNPLAFRKLISKEIPLIAPKLGTKIQIS